MGQQKTEPAFSDEQVKNLRERLRTFADNSTALDSVINLESAQLMGFVSKTVQGQRLIAAISMVVASELAAEEQAVEQAQQAAAQEEQVKAFIILEAMQAATAYANDANNINKEIGQKAEAEENQEIATKQAEALANNMPPITLMDNQQVQAWNDAISFEKQAKQQLSELASIGSKKDAVLSEQKYKANIDSAHTSISKGTPQTDTRLRLNIAAQRVELLKEADKDNDEERYEDGKAKSMAAEQMQNIILALTTDAEFAKLGGLLNFDVTGNIDELDKFNKYLYELETLGLISSFEVADIKSALGNNYLAANNPENNNASKDMYISFIREMKTGLRNERSQRILLDDNGKALPKTDFQKATFAIPAGHYVLSFRGEAYLFDNKESFKFAQDENGHPYIDNDGKPYLVKSTQKIVEEQGTKYLLNANQDFSTLSDEAKAKAAKALETNQKNNEKIIQSAHENAEKFSLDPTGLAAKSIQNSIETTQKQRSSLLHRIFGKSASVKPSASWANKLSDMPSAVYYGAKYSAYKVRALAGLALSSPFLATSAVIGAVAGVTVAITGGTAGYAGGLVGGAFIGGYESGKGAAKLLNDNFTPKWDPNSSLKSVGKFALAFVASPLAVGAVAIASVGGMFFNNKSFETAAKWGGALGKGGARRVSSVLWSPIKWSFNRALNLGSQNKAQEDAKKALENSQKPLEKLQEKEEQASKALGDLINGPQPRTLVIEAKIIAQMEIKGSATLERMAQELKVLEAEKKVAAVEDGLTYKELNNGGGKKAKDIEAKIESLNNQIALFKARNELNIAQQKQVLVNAEAATDKRKLETLKNNTPKDTKAINNAQKKSDKSKQKADKAQKAVEVLVESTANARLKSRGISKPKPAIKKGQKSKGIFGRLSAMRSQKKSQTPLEEAQDNRNEALKAANVTPKVLTFEALEPLNDKLSEVEPVELTDTEKLSLSENDASKNAFKNASDELRDKKATVKDKKKAVGECREINEEAKGKLEAATLDVTAKANTLKDKQESLKKSSVNHSSALSLYDKASSEVAARQAALDNILKSQPDDIQDDEPGELREAIVNDESIKKDVDGVLEIENALTEAEKELNKAKKEFENAHVNLTKTLTGLEEATTYVNSAKAELNTALSLEADMEGTYQVALFNERVAENDLIAAENDVQAATLAYNEVVETQLIQNSIDSANKQAAAQKKKAAAAPKPEPTADPNATTPSADPAANQPAVSNKVQPLKPANLQREAIRINGSMRDDLYTKKNNSSGGFTFTHKTQPEITGAIKPDGTGSISIQKDKWPKPTGDENNPDVAMAKEFAATAVNAGFDWIDLPKNFIPKDQLHNVVSHMNKLRDDMGKPHIRVKVDGVKFELSTNPTVSSGPAATGGPPVTPTPPAPTPTVQKRVLEAFNQLVDNNKSIPEAALSIAAKKRIILKAVEKANITPEELKSLDDISIENMIKICLEVGTVNDTQPKGIKSLVSHIKIQVEKLDTPPLALALQGDEPARRSNELDHDKYHEDEERLNNTSNP